MTWYGRLTEEDAKTWAEYTQGIKPLVRTTPLIGKIELQKKSAMKALPSLPAHALPKVPTSRELKNVRIHSKLDLHGLVLEQAYKRLLQFIDKSSKAGHRCVLVITGKGSSPQRSWWEESNLLRNEVPRWLEEEPLRSKINSFTTARPEHGGTGALYVFMRKKQI